MAKRDFDEYFKKAFNQLRELNETLKRANEEALNNMCDFDFVEKVKARKIAVEENFKTLSWIKYLIDMPNKKEKKKKFANVEPYKSLDKKYSQDEILKRNQQIIKELDKGNK